MDGDGQQAGTDVYRNDPAAFVREVLGGKPWPTQEAVLQALADHQRVTVRSCHGVGKTWLAACSVLWFLYTREPAVVLTTAPTHRQVKEVLWREIRRQHRRMWPDPKGASQGSGTQHGFPPAFSPAWRGELRETALRLADDRFALGLTTDEADRFQGFHSPHVLVVVDEASGVNEEIFQAIQGVLTGEEARLLLIGNPLHARGTFYESHRSSTWQGFCISAFDTPNLCGSTIEMLADPAIREVRASVPGLVTRRWVWDRYQDWGADSPMYQTRVLGEFPDFATDALIPLSWIRDAMARSLEEVSGAGPVVLGADIARFGDCESAVCVRQGARVLALRCWRGADLMETARRIAGMAQEWGARQVLVDGVGLGGGVVDRLRELGAPGLQEVNVGRAPRNSERFCMLRDELFFGLRDRLRAGDLCLPNDAVLAEQLASLTYRITPRGQQTVGSKGEMREQGLPSPDRADALVLSFAVSPQHQGAVRVGPPR